MGYERIQKPEGLLYHYTRKENLESILRDGRIRKFCDRETWFTKSLADTLRLMSLTVMQEGAAYYDASGRLQRYPAFVPEDYVVLELTPRYQSGEWVIWNPELRLRAMFQGQSCNNRVLRQQACWKVPRKMAAAYSFSSQNIHP